MKKPHCLFSTTIAISLFALTSNLYATPLKTISGSVYQQKQSYDGMATQRGRHFQDVFLHLIDADGKIVAQTRTDRFGNYRFSGVRPGSYQIQVPLNTSNPKDINRLLLDRYTSPTGSYRDVDVSDSNAHDVDLRYFYIDLRSHMKRQENAQRIDY